MKTRQTRPGPSEDRLKIDGGDWEKAVHDALAAGKPPPDQRPAHPKKKRKARRTKKA